MTDFFHLQPTAQHRTTREERQMKKEEFTEDQKYCIEALSIWARGEHRLPKIHKFESGVCVNVHFSLSTYDDDKLTYLVLIGHHMKVRFSIQSSGPGRVKITAFRRDQGERADLKFWQFHPSLDDLVDRIGKFERRDR